MKKIILFLVLFSQCFLYGMNIQFKKEEEVEITEKTPLLHGEKKENEELLDCSEILKREVGILIEFVFEYLSSSDLKNIKYANTKMQELVKQYLDVENEDSTKDLSYSYDGNKFLHNFEHFRKMKKFVTQDLFNFIEGSKRKGSVVVTFKQKDKEQLEKLLISGEKSACENREAMAKFFYGILYQSVNKKRPLWDMNLITGKPTLYLYPDILIERLEKKELSSFVDPKTFASSQEEIFFVSDYDGESKIFGIKILKYKDWNQYKELKKCLNDLKRVLFRDLSISLRFSLSSDTDLKDMVEVVPAVELANEKDVLNRVEIIKNLPTIFAIILPNLLVGDIENRLKSFSPIGPSDIEEKVIYTKRKKSQILKFIKNNRCCFFACSLCSLLYVVCVVSYFFGTCVVIDYDRVDELFKSNFTNTNDTFMAGNNVICDIPFPGLYWLLYLLKSI